MSKSCEILIFCMIFVVNDLSAQQNQLKYNPSKDFKNIFHSGFSPDRSQVYPTMSVPANFYVKNLGFFCQKELKLEAATKIPFRFRLGSLNYCDRMEGKRNVAITDR